MKVLAKILKYVGLSFLFVFTVLIALLATIWVRPEVLLNEKRARQALQYAPAGTEVSWKSFRWDFERHGWLAKRSDLELRDLCFKYGGQYEGCLPLVHLDFTFAFRSLLPSITRIDFAEIAASEILMRPGKEEAPKPSPTGPLPDLRAPSFAAFYPAAISPETLGRVALTVESFKMLSKEGPPLLANLRLAKRSEVGSRDINFSFDAHASQGKTLDIHADGDARIPEGTPAFSFSGAVKGVASGWKISTPVRFRWSDKLNLQASPDLRNGASRYQTDVTVAWTKEMLNLQTGALPLGQPMPGRRMGIDRCLVDSTLDKKKGYPASTKFSCTLALHSRTPTKLLPSVESTIFGEAKLRPLNQTDVAAEVILQERGDRPLLPTKIDGRVETEFNLAKGELIGTPKLEFAASLGLDDLARWVPILRGTPYAVPAPLNVLSGPLRADIKLDRVDGRRELELNTVFTTDLRGGEQSFVTRADAKIRVTEPFDAKRAVYIDGKYVLRDVQLEAPPLSLGLPPNALPDARFVTRAELAAQEQAKRAAKLNPGLPIHWNMVVSNEQPVRVRTNLLPNAVPLAINLTLNDKAGMQGSVQVLPMPIKLFSKKANVERLKVSFLKDSDLLQLDGLIDHKNAEVDIRILLLGNASAPRIEFESDPPLQRDQILQVLLFNKSLAEVQKQQVSDDEASSASNVGQAMSDRAFGLFSLFFLSSTPIQSVGYDPGSQTYSIRFKLGDKTSLALGSNFGGSREVSLRRSLGGPWAIRTELRQTEQAPNKLLTLLEWFKRF